MEDVGPRTVVATATTAENPTIPLITYNHTTLASNTYSSDQSRDPSLSSRPSLPWTPYSDSSIGLDKDSIDDHHSRFSHVHTPESSYGTRPPSVNEEALRYHRRRQGKFKIPEERFNPSDRYRRSHRGRRGRHAHSSHRQPQRKERRDSANTGCLRYTKYTETPADIVLDPQPSKITVVGDKLTKKTKNNGTTWRRIRQGLVLGKSKKKEQTEEQPPVEAEDVPKKKSKWKFWAKQPPVDDAEASDAPKTSDTDDEPMFSVTSDSRPSLLEAHEEAPISVHLHAVMRRVSKGD
ncbi:hypothetical protein H9Q69_003050 [Fusarium xylarioides]|uniref:Uncharacterized protein n=1 Tax=Fusarium xylarioides TaxID=221167 RepID=A0A9P7HV58_9HYPO|nr:hypothetical protein H9Q70_002506 [Fusarium xylarioides]KAG5766420.1 hypothetical protein H9Q72_005513 [Fusarium xylarioides]KAG5784147.1 hypothetical protein H9Q73_002205 [Fusarium xylarioides]KAG5797893.1 hypothetical protein H9Q69_003050 [Fusarium xylarioides]KAG5810012.1 hypothetical protein H9Q71_005774 [Fusarium xylarioides]